MSWQEPQAVVFLCVSIVIVAALVAYAVLAARARRRELFGEQYPAKLYVRPLWGVANRFRTLNVAYDLARILKVELVVLENDDTYWTAKMDDLCSVPFPDANSPPMRVIDTDTFYRVTPRETFTELIYNVEGDCSRRTSVSEVRAIISAGRSAVIYACGLFIDLPSPLTDDFYKRMRLSPRMAAELGPITTKIRETRAIGVHSRSGNQPDHKNGWMFTKWESDKTKHALFCCHKDASKNLSACPSTATPIEKFMDAMNKFGKDQVFFVAADRIPCIILLLQEFPDRVLYTPRKDLVEKVIDSETAFKDWWCLGECSRLVLSGISSFSGESVKRRAVPAEFLGP